MKSRIEFRFSQDIYTDTGTLYSKEYMENRKAQKLAFLKSLDIVPNIPLTEANISLSPNRATLLGNFDENTKYTITLHNLEDIYGRKTNLTFDITPHADPLLYFVLMSQYLQKSFL
jgi:hypothetical protein